MIADYYLRAALENSVQDYDTRAKLEPLGKPGVEEFFKSVVDNLFEQHVLNFRPEAEEDWFVIS